MGSSQSRAVSPEKHKKVFKELQAISAQPFNNLPKIFEAFSASKKVQKKAESDPRLSLIVKFYCYETVLLQCDTMLPLVRRGYSPIIHLTTELKSSLHDLKEDLMITRTLDQSKGCQFVSFENEIKASFAIDGLQLNENRLEQAAQDWHELTEIVRTKSTDIIHIIDSWTKLQSSLCLALADSSKKNNEERLTGLRSEGMEVVYGNKDSNRHYGAYGKDVKFLFERLIEAVIELSKATNNLQFEHKFILSALTGWQLCVIHPFMELNGVIGRLFTIWALRYTRSARSPSQLFISNDILNSPTLHEKYESSFGSSRIDFLSAYLEPAKIPGTNFSFRNDAPTTKYFYECPDLTDGALFASKLFHNIIQTVIEYENKLVEDINNLEVDGNK